MSYKFCMAGLMMLLAASVSAQEIHGWRGPNRDGFFPETGLLKEWPAQGPALKWESNVIGKGYSSPTIVDNRLYITGMDEDETHEVFYCFDLQGKLLYSTVYSTPWTQSYPETRTTPAIQGDKAWVISGSGDVVCLNIADVWRNEELDTHHGHQILLDGVLYGSNWTSNNAGNWMAVDWETGKTLWETPWPGGKGKGSIVSSDGKLYQYDERRGFVALVNPSREKLDIISEFRITKGEGPYWAHPVIQDGVMYIRHGSYLAAYAVK